jgi:DNA-directed RNA polymerase subunit M/transcription elongation factor TFIIS
MSFCKQCKNLAVQNVTKSGELVLECRINPNHIDKANVTHTLVSQSTSANRSSAEISESALVSVHDPATYRHPPLEKCPKCGLKHNFQVKIVAANGLTTTVQQCEGAFYDVYKKMEAALMTVAKK